MDIQRFANLMVSSGLSNKVEAADLVSEFQEDCCDHGTLEAIDAFCDFLIARSQFTAYQCGKLREGKWKGFYLDNHLILEHVGKDHESSSYKARETRSGRLVVLVVTAGNLTDGRMEYRVEPYAG
jgi:eukaryotic-like serine/threonine-protein kinase